MASEVSESNQYKRLIIALVVLFGIAGGFILYLSWPLLTGTTIVLATTPIDPFDPLRGQYMVVNYEISTIPNNAFTQGDTVFISISPDEEEIWRLDDVSLVKPDQGVFIKGKIKTIWAENARVEFGIEQFFFEQFAQVPTQDVTVKAKVSAGGQARIVELLKDGKPVEIKYEPVSIKS